MIMNQQDAAIFLDVDISALKIEFQQAVKVEPLVCRQPSIEQIQRRICQRFNLTIFELVSRSRSMRIARPRQIGFWLTRKLTTHSSPLIGRYYSKDHTTVLYGIKRVQEWSEHEDTTAWYNAARLLYQEMKPA